jgi:WD40 repeat protein
MGVYFGLILIIGLLFAGYQYQRSTTATPPSGSSTEPNATQGLNATAIIQATQKPVSTPTAGVITDQSNPTPTIAAQAEPPARIFKPAFEGETPLLTDQAITIANLQNIREVARLGYGKPEDADISADGKYFAVASSAGVFIFSGTQLIRWIDPQDWATSVKFSNNVSLIAIGVQSGAIQLWDWQNEIQSATLTGHTGKITRIIFSRNDRLLYSASFDQHVRVWDLNQKTSIKDISAHSTRVNDIAVTSEGRILISCSDDQLIRIWDVASAKKVIEIKFDGKVKALAISPDDAYFAAGGESGFIYQRDLVDYQLRNNPIPVKKRIWNLQYENNNTLLAGVDNGETLLFSANEQTNRGFAGFEIKPPPSDLIDVYGASFDFDSYSVSYSGAIISLNWDGQVKAGPVQVLKPTYDNLDRLDFSKDGTLLASGGRRGTTNVWRLTNNAPLLKEAFIMPRGDPIAPDGSAMVVTIQDAYRLISLANGQRVRDFSEVVANSRVGYDRSGSIFISESLTESKTWDYVSGYETYFAGSTQGGCRMTKSANNGEILSVNSAAGALTIWDTWSNTLCAKIGQYRNTLSAVSADSKLLTYLAADGQLEGFDPVNNRVWKFKPNTTVTALAVSPDGSLVALGNADGKLSFINGRTGEKLWEITGNFGALQAIVFSEDGTKIATAGYDGTTRVFGIGITK